MPPAVLDRRRQCEHPTSPHRATTAEADRSQRFLCKVHIGTLPPQRSSCGTASHLAPSLHRCGLWRLWQRSGSSKAATSSAKASSTGVVSPLVPSPVVVLCMPGLQSRGVRFGVLMACVAITYQHCCARAACLSTARPLQRMNHGVHRSGDPGITRCVVSSQAVRLPAGQHFAPRRRDLRCTRPRWGVDNACRYGRLRIRPDRPGPSRTERCPEVDGM
jgi:hypothetical protein